MLGSVRCAKPPTLSSHLGNLTALLLDGVFKHHTYNTITITTISMGKNKNKRKRGGDHHQSSQRRHKKGFWIDTCRESSFKRRSDLSLTVWITQVNLTDNHVHVMSREKEKQDEAADVPKNRLVIKESVEEDPMTTTKPSALPPEDVDQEVVGASSHQASAEQDAQSDKPEMIDMTSNRPSENTASADKPPGWQQAFISIQRAPSAKEAPKKVRAERLILEQSDWIFVCQCIFLSSSSYFSFFSSVPQEKLQAAASWRLWRWHSKSTFSC
jgi:hypothetical protein